MSRLRSLRPALVAVATLLPVVLPGMMSGMAAADDGPAGPAAPFSAAAVGKPLVADPAARVSRRPSLVATRRAARGNPLAVTIDTLSPSVIPTTGPVVLTGTVTNVDTRPWRAINLYATFLGVPITTRDGLVTATRSKVSSPVGQRIVLDDPATSANIDLLAPGTTARWAFYVPRSELVVDRLATTRVPVSTPGVYWFGVQAVAEVDDAPRDDLADGRARTFLSLVPPGRTAVRTALVLPIRREVTFSADGRVADLPGWTRTFGLDGRLRQLVELGAAAGDRPVSWLVDPSVVDAARRLAAGNPARSLAPTLAPGVRTKPSASPSASPSALVPSTLVPSAARPATGTPSTTGPEGSGGDPPGPPDTAGLDPETRTAAAAAELWLARLRTALTGQEILALPYGDPDVAAAAASAPDLYGLARRRSGTMLAPWGLPMRPAVASPSGFLDEAAVEMVDPGSTILVTDQAFAGTVGPTVGDRPPDPRTPSVASAAGRTIVVTSAAAAAGGPRPGDPQALLPMRQRILAEAALHAIRPGARPLTVLMPPDWTPLDDNGSADDFFAGLDVDWLDLTGVDGPQGVAESPATPVDLDALTYPDTQAGAELGRESFDAAHSLIRTGAALQDILLRNDQVAGQVTDQALASTSYSARRHAATTTATTEAARAWIASRLEAVQVSGPTSVTLSSSSGRFAATVVNKLDQPVTVRLRAEGDSDVTVAVPRSIEIAARGRKSVPLEADTSRDGVHRVTLVVTDSQGRALGSSDELPVRSAEVSRLIWLTLALGAALLFGTLALRVVRRIRAGHP